MKAIVAGNLPDKIIHSLEEFGFELMLTVPCKNVLNGLEYHPDMQIARFENYAVCEPTVYEYYRDFIKSSGVIPVLGKTHLSSTYPNDIAYNISEVGKFIFHNTAYTDGEIIFRTGKEFVNTAQGYSGCSICRISEGGIITADKSIYKAALKIKVDCLLISPDGIELDGFDKGFIGGASFLKNDTVFFFGDISLHADYERIKDFCLRHKTEIRPLTSEVLSDFGSLITLD